MKTCVKLENTFMCWYFVRKVHVKNSNNFQSVLMKKCNLSRSSSSPELKITFLVQSNFFFPIFYSFRKFISISLSSTFFFLNGITDAVLSLIYPGDLFSYISILLYEFKFNISNN